MIYRLSENIKALRSSIKISQVDFARMLGVTKQCVSNWENDNVLPSIEMLAKIAELFGVTTDYLLGRSNVAIIDISALTEDQRGYINLLVKEFTALNAQAAANQKPE